MSKYKLGCSPFKTTRHMAVSRRQRRAQFWEDERLRLLRKNPPLVMATPPRIRKKPPDDPTP